MSIDQLTATKSKGGITFICAKCQAPGMAARGATDKAELCHLLICPVCQTTLGEWLTIEDRERELKALADKLVQMLLPKAFPK